MLRYIFTTILVCICLFRVHAIPAYPKKILMDINGKEKYVRLFGDEHSKRLENEEGYTIVQNEDDEWCYAILDGVGQLRPSPYKVGESYSELKAFVSSLPFHLSEKTHHAALSYRAPKQPAIGQRRMLIILMEFPDRKFVKNNEDFENLFNQVNYSDDGAQGSVRDYFYRSSYGQLVLSCDVYGPYQTTKTMSNYGRNNIIGGSDKDPTALFEEAIEKVSEEADLQAYDGDKDGFIDNVHIIYAGYGEEAGGPSTAIWAHEAAFLKPYEIQGQKVDRYSCAAELRGNSGSGISRIGPHCHEIGHALGAMDFYDTDYAENGLYEGTGDWDLMASGSWNNEGITPADINPYVKIFCYGWTDSHSLPTGNIVIPPSDANKDAYYLLEKDNEYYLLENRNPQQYNDGLPGKGLLLFHVHSDIEKAGNEINNTAPQKCYVVCASANDGVPRSSGKDYGSINSESCPFPGSSNNTEFSTSSTPKAFWWSGAECRISLHDIALLPDGNISLYNDSHESDSKGAIGSESFFDGFETPKDYIQFTSAQAKWERVKNSGYVDMIAGRPVPYEGVYCLQLSAKNSIGNSVSTIRFGCTFDSDATEIVLSGFFISKGLNKREANLLRIAWHPKENDSWEYYDFEVPVNDIWTPFTLRIPPSPEYEFSIEGTAQMGSILGLDNLKIEQQLVTNINMLLSRDKFENSNTTVYGLYGEKRETLSKGINIIRQKDGTVKKVFVK